MGQSSNELDMHTVPDAAPPAANGATLPTVRRRGIPKGPLHKFLLADALVGVLALLLAFYLCFGSLPVKNFGFYPKLIVPLLGVRFFIFLKFGLYDFRQSYTALDIAYLTIGGLLLSRLIEGFVISYFILYVQAEFEYEVARRILVIYDPILTCLGSIAWRCAYLGRRRVWAYDLARTAIVGEGEDVLRVAEGLRVGEKTGHQIVGYVGDGNGHDTLPRHLGGADRLRSILEQNDIDEVIIAGRTATRVDLLNLIATCQAFGVQVRLLPELYEYTIGKVDIALIDDLPLITVHQEPASDWTRFWKRTEDLFFAFFGIIVLLLILPFVGTTIALSGPGGVFYRQRRVGRNGRVFKLIKFRTMVKDAEKLSGPTLSPANDPRVTAIGRWLRRFHLDEFPQVINVLRGEMSMVGPRPERPAFYEEIVQDLPAYRMRLAVKPGLTGLAQVHGYYDVSPEEKLRYDLAYLSNISVLLDLRILWLTLRASLLGGSSANSGSM